jgi:RHS repeat-associated protein
MDMLENCSFQNPRSGALASATAASLRCLLAGFTALSAIVCALLVTTFLVFPKPAHAINGQCVWEGGPGMTLYPECRLEDCFSDGGVAHCSEPALRPPSGYNDSQVDGQMYEYAFSTANEYDLGDFCQGDGGVWNGFYGSPPCAGLSGYNSLGNASSEPGANGGALAGMNWKFSKGSYNPDPTATNPADCGGAKDLGGTAWGDTTTPMGPPVYQNGQVIQDYRTETYAPGDSSCSPSASPLQIKVYFTRSRQLLCPQQFDQRRLPNGYLQCFIPSSGCVACDVLNNLSSMFLVDNPVSPVTGGKFEARIDYQAGGAGGLTFGHYYNSLGHFRPPGGGPFLVGFSDYWHFSYDRQLFPLGGSPRILAALHREDGTVEWFDASGNEILNRGGAADRLTANSGGGWTLTLANNDVEQYDSFGKLTSITTRSGVVTTLTYTDGQLTQITDSFGHTLQLSYAAGFLSTVTLPDGISTITYGYGAQGQLTDINYADHSNLHYAYSDPNNSWLLTGINDENGQRYATYIYNGQGVMAHEEHAGGADSYDFSVGGISSDLTHVSTVATDSLGQTHQYVLNNQSGVFKLNASTPYCDGCPNTSSSSYDANGNPQAVNDLNNNQTTYVYDQIRNLEISRTEGLSGAGQPTASTRTTTTQWHPTFRLPTQVSIYNGAAATGTPAQTTSYTYDGYGNQLTRTITDGATGASRTWTTQYYNSGLYSQIQSVDGPRTDVPDVTSYTYYNCTSGAQCGQLHTITDALGHTTSYDAYDANGMPLQITDPNGTVTLLTYDPRQRIKTRTVGGEQTRYDYYLTGLLQKVTQPDGSYLTYIYDGAHRLTEVDDASGDRLVYTLDGVGHRIQQQSYDPSGVLARTQRSVYNNLGQLWQELTSTGSTSQATVFGYDLAGNRSSIQAPLARNTSNAYDELNRLRQTTDPAGGNSTFSYDALGNLISVTDPRNLTTRYTYNGLGDLQTTLSPDTGTTQASFDSGGNLHTRTDARGTTATYVYDALNRPTQLIYPDQTITYTYDQGPSAIGRLSRVADGSGQTTFSYDALGRIVQKQHIVGGVTLTVGYAYQNGRLASVTTPSGQSVVYTYDASGRPSGITLNGAPLLNSIQYSPFGPLTAWTWGNGTQTSRSYDTDGRLFQLQSAGTSTYTFNDDGTIASRSDDTEHDYSVVPGTTTLSVATTSNQLVNTTGVMARSYSYDPAGNTTSTGTLISTYNGAGRPIATAQGNATTAYGINALGQRVSKTSPTATTLFAYDELGHLIGEYTATGALVEETVWLGDTPVATLRPNSSGTVDVYYVHTDHLNTPRRITRATDNTIVWRWSSDPFGTGFVDQDPDGDGQVFVYNLRFPGQYYDVETGLSYNYFRDYDPAAGRYIESDPIGLWGGINTYAYANGNPISGIDPTGQFAPPPVMPGPAAAATVGWAIGTYVGSLIYNANAVAIQDALERRFPYSRPAAAASPSPASASAPPLPPAANDPNFGDHNCPPDCKAWRELLNRMYQALLKAEEVPTLHNSLDVHWMQFQKSVRAYEKECGPYTPPPSIDEIYTR